MDHLIALPSAGSIAVAAIALFLAVTQGLFALRRPRYGWTAWGSLISFSTFGYSLAVAFQYNSERIDLVQLVDRIQLSFILLLIHGLYGYTLSFFGIASRKKHAVIGFIHLVFLAFIWGTGLIVSSELTSRNFFLLGRPYVESEYGPAGALFLCYMIAAALYTLFIWVARFRENARIAFWYIAGFTAWFLMALHDFLASLGMPAPLFIMEYGFLSFSIFVLAVSLRVYDNLVARLHKREAALEEEMERLFTTLSSIGDGVVAVDQNERISLMNPVAEELTGWKEHSVRGTPVQEILLLIDASSRLPVEDFIKKAGKTGVPVHRKKTTVLIARDGTERIIADSCAPMHDREGKIIGFVVVFRDITDRIKTEEVLAKARNSESLAILAGGIAHDFNNILTSIVGNVSLACLNLDPNDHTYKLLSDAKKASFSARDLTRQLLAFSRGGAPVKRTATLVELIRDTVEFALSGSRVKCVFHLPGDLWAADVDQGQISQVLNNIVINADQALDGGGVIEVRAENLHVFRDRIITGMEEPQHMPPGKYVKISVRDRGSGIPEEHQKRIFEPYFTTKQRGMGLGLATVYSIVKKHEGYIQLESKPGAGTTFSFYLPAAEGNPQLQDADEGGIFGKGKILIVDEEEDVARVSLRLVAGLGYDADSALSIDLAVDKYNYAMAQGAPFDVVIVDLTMSGTDGARECLARLKKIDDNVKAVVSSGYSNDHVIMEYWNFGFSAALRKPYSLEDLGRAIRETIAGPIRGKPLSEK